MGVLGERQGRVLAGLTVALSVVALGACGGDDGSEQAQQDAAEALGAPPGLGPEGEAAAVDDPACELLTVDEVGEAVGGEVTVQSRAEPGEVGPCQYVGTATLNVFRSDPAAGAAGATEWFEEAKTDAQAVGGYVATDVGDEAFTDGGQGTAGSITVLAGGTAFRLECVLDAAVLESLATTAAANAGG